RVGNFCSAAPQPRANDADGVGRAEPPFLETLGEGEHVRVAQCVFEFGERTERQAKAIGLAVENGFNLSTMRIDHAHYSGVKVSSPADSSEISKASSPSCWPVNSSEVIWNKPCTVPKSGMIACHSMMIPPKKDRKSVV